MQDRPSPPANLLDLRLNPDELHALRRQGFVTQESRAGRTVYRLRFRYGDRLCTRYLGRNAAVAQRIQRQLECWQAMARQQRQIASLSRRVDRVLRRSRKSLRTILGAAGYSIRSGKIRRRRPTDNVQLATNWQPQLDAWRELVDTTCAAFQAANLTPRSPLGSKWGSGNGDWGMRNGAQRDAAISKP